MAGVGDAAVGEYWYSEWAEQDERERNGDGRTEAPEATDKTEKRPYKQWSKHIEREVTLAKFTSNPLSKYHKSTKKGLDEFGTTSSLLSTT